MKVQSKTHPPYSLKLPRAKMNVALICFSPDSISPAGVISNCPSGEKASRRKNDLNVSSWNSLTALGLVPSGALAAAWRGTILDTLWMQCFVDRL